MIERNIYLNSVDLSEVDVIIDNLTEELYQSRSWELVNVTSSLGRVTSEEVIARISAPYYNASAMDGIAVISDETSEASESNMITLSNNHFKVVNTGNPIPDDFNSVIMIEDVIGNKKTNEVSIIKSAAPFQHIRPIGEDIVEGEMIIPRNHKIRPVDIAALLSGGISKIKVIKKPLVLIIPTGSEIISDPDKIEVGKIIDSNSHYIANTVKELGGLPIIYGVVEDEYSKLKQAILESSKMCDILIIGAGSSSGTKDYTKAIIEELGEVIVHGISIKPGKPTIIGKINNKIVIGLPGFPVSTFISFDLIVKPIIMKLLNQTNINRQRIKAHLSKKVYSSLKHQEYVRVKLGYVGNKLIATPLNRGAGVTMSLVKADGLMVVDKNKEGIEAKTEVFVELFKSLDEVKKTLISIGSHDPILDMIDDLMSQNKFRLSSAHVGSFGGVMAIKNNECHIAPVHILDEEDGRYNEFIYKKYLKDHEMVLVKGVSRIQGLIIKKGNPKNINSINSLINKDVLFVNRQRGSGTRILFDYLLKKNKIKKKDINGYSYELATHMMVSSAISEGRADVGMGIESVANIMNLDFIKVSEEEYDFLVSKSIINTPIFTNFLKVLRSDEFKNRLNNLGGYLLKNTGKIIDLQNR